MKNQIDFNEGELKETSNPLDLAISGDGFFALINANGEKVYTRDGQFYSNFEGTLVNSMGHEFSDEGGNPITLAPGQPDPLIDQEGQVFQGE
jgi:flagellar hook-basal body protein